VPFILQPFRIFVSPLFGVVPKKDPGSYRLMHHLPYTYGLSLNDELATPSFDSAVDLLRKFCQSTLMSKMDIKSVFRLLPLHPDGLNSFGFLL
ncbi:unnamed protein product, partial [Ranitomeya imitator]